MLGGPAAANPVNTYLPDALSEVTSAEVVTSITDLFDGDEAAETTLEVFAKNGVVADRRAAHLALARVKATRAEDAVDARAHLQLCIDLEPTAPDCYVWMGLFHSFGTGGAKDAVAAVTAYRRASELGSPSGDWHLAMTLLRGKGVSKDEDAAFLLVEDAARADYIPALASYGTMYALGQGVATDPRRAFDANARAATLGDARSLFVIAVSYGDGSGVKRDLNKADATYVLAGMRGNPQASAMIKNVRDWPEKRQNAFRASAESNVGAVLAEIKKRGDGLFPS